MAYNTIKDLFKGICDAIRSKDGTTGNIPHQDIPNKIQKIETGITPTGSLRIEENGTHDVTNYASAEVDVAFEYIPNLEDITITENGTYSPSSGYDGIGEVTVEVESGGVSAETCSLTIASNLGLIDYSATVIVDGCVSYAVASLEELSQDTIIIENIPVGSILMIKYDATMYSVSSISYYLNRLCGETKNGEGTGVYKITGDSKISLSNND